MCRMFAGQDPASYACETRSMRLNGYCTSIRLEAAFWRVLEDLAASEGISVPQFVGKLHDEVQELRGEVSNFTSLLRCACLIHLERNAGPAAGIRAA